MISRAIVRTSLRLRLIALFVLVAVITAAAFTAPSYAKRAIDLFNMRGYKPSLARTTKPALRRLHGCRFPLVRQSDLRREGR